jgi:uncharacterized protein (TIGR02466 family)
MSNYHLEGIFTHFLHHLKVDISQELLSFCYEQKKLDPVGVKLSNCGGWQSKEFIEDKSIANNLIENILSRTSEVFTQQLLLENFWININSPDTYNSMHVHPNSNISGVIWIKIPKDSGNLYFPNPDNFQKYKEINFYKSFLNQGEGYELEPQKGNVVLFPSCLQHEVTKNLSNDERVSISFNSNFAL